MECWTLHALNCRSFIHYMAEFIVHKYIVYISVPFRTQFMCERRDKLQPLRYNSKGLIILTAAFGLVIWAWVTWLSFVASRCSRREGDGESGRSHGRVGGVAHRSITRVRFSRLCSVSAAAARIWGSSLTHSPSRVSDTLRSRPVSSHPLGSSEPPRLEVSEANHE